VGMMNGDGANRSNGGKLNVGDWAHIIQIIALVFSIGVVYQKFDIFTAQVSVHTQQLDRIEHYLSSHDANYWQQSKRDE
jgi:hypothetical protein